jgi:hypothetical protein
VLQLDVVLRTGVDHSPLDEYSLSSDAERPWLRLQRECSCTGAVLEFFIQIDDTFAQTFSADVIYSLAGFGNTIAQRGLNSNVAASNGSSRDAKQLILVQEMQHRIKTI